MVLTLLPSDFRFWLLSFGVDTCVLGVDTSIQNAFHRFFDNLSVKSLFFLYDILPWIYMIFVYFYQIQIDELFRSFTDLIILASGLKVSTLSVRKCLRGFL